MNIYKADLHIHTVLSPCGDLEMSPLNIIRKAKEKGIDIIGITDHNSTKHCELVEKIGKANGVFVLKGAEVTTKEEVHCLAFFDNIRTLNEFQLYLELNLPDTPNNPEKFGYQVVVDENENIIENVEKLLISALGQSIDQIEKKVHQLGGIFIPAHVNRSKNSLISQLGFVPSNLKVEALEISKHITKEEFLMKNQYLKNYTFIQSSDAHFIENIGDAFTTLTLEELSFAEIKRYFSTNQYTIY
jgi:PHP family Zn ribbon phosphoesterase